MGMGRFLEVGKDQTATGSLRADMASPHHPPTVAKVITLGVQDKNGVRVRGPMGGITGEGELIESRPSEVAGGAITGWS